MRHPISILCAAALTLSADCSLTRASCCSSLSLSDVRRSISERNTSRTHGTPPADAHARATEVGCCLLQLAAGH